MFFLICVLVGGFSPQPIPLPFPQADKLLHFIVFGVLTFLFLLVVLDRCALFVFLSMAILGVLIEVGQGLLLPSRNFSWLDLLANIIGSLVSFLLYFQLIYKRNFS